MAHNFSKIGEAESLLKDAGIGDWEDVKSILSGDGGAKEFAGMMKEGRLMTVSFVPDFSGARKIRFPSEGRTKLRSLGDMLSDGADRNQASVIRRVREWGESMRAAFVERALEYRFCQMNVGIIGDPTHYGYMSSLKYSVLFYLLLNKGYDPLWPLRQPDVKKKIETAMGNAILEELSRYARRGGVLNIKRGIKAVGRWAVDTVQEYIYGGEKPELDKETVKARRWRAGEEGGGSLYKGKSGIDEPLYETGNLFDAIDFTITVNDGLFAYLDKKDNESRAAEKRLVKTIREAYATRERERTRKREKTRTIRSAAGEGATGREVAVTSEQARKAREALGYSRTKAEGKTVMRTRDVQQRKPTAPKQMRSVAAKKERVSSVMSMQKILEQSEREAENAISSFAAKFKSAFESLPKELGITKGQFAKNWSRFIVDDFEKEDISSLLETAKKAAAFLRSRGFLIKGIQIIGRPK